MSYRDDLQASQARANALEQELAEARSKISELEGDKKNEALVRVGTNALARGSAGSPSAKRWLGAPTRLEFARDVEGEVPETSYTELVEAIRAALGSVGAVSTLPGSLAWSATNASNGLGPFVSVYITIRDGQTVIRAEEKVGNLAGAIYGGVGGGVGGGALFVPISVAIISPWLLPVALPLWLGGTYAVCRKLFRGRVKSRAERLETLIDELVAIAEKHIARADDGDS